MEIFSGIIKKIKELIAGQDKKRLIENTAAVIIIGMIIIIAGSVLMNPKKENASAPARQEDGTAETSENRMAAAGDSTEIKLRNMLSRMQGVGKVDVMITYSSSAEYVPAYDTKKSSGSSEERDGEGGARVVRQEEYESTIAYEDSPSGGRRPVVLKQMEPEVRGVLIVAEGAENAEVRNRICNAAAAVLDVPVHKVQVVQRKK